MGRGAAQVVARLAESFPPSDERLKLIAIGSVVGACGALASIVLTRGLETGASLLAPLRSEAWAFVLPALGAGLSSVVLRQVFRETGGHGVTEVIYSISRRGGLLRLRSAFSRLLGALLTIASGGSAGPEAPVVISGASIGSNIGSMFKVNDRQRFVIVGCGAAGAIASIFNAPMAGIAFSLEAILGEWRPVHVVPIAVAAVVATEVSRILEGNRIPFEHRLFHASGMDLVATLGLALVCALAAVILVRLLEVVERRGSTLVLVPWLRAACGGIIVGGIGMVVPAVLGEGYETVREAIEGTYLPGVEVAAVAGLAKVVATSVTVGSGGSGGLFAPCLVVGSLFGVTYQRGLSHASPFLPVAGEGFFALMGMAGILSSVLQAPLTGIFLVIEITGSYEVVAPVVLVAVVSATVSHYFEPHSVYQKELVTRGDLLRPGTDARVMADLTLSEVVERECATLNPEMRLGDLVAVMQRTRQSCYPVLQRGTRRYLGMVDVDEIRPYLFDQSLPGSVLIEDLMNRDIGAISPDTEIQEVMDRFEALGVTCLAVASGARFIGLVSKANVLEYYRKELIVQEDQQ